MPKLKFVEVKKNYRGLRTFLRDLLIILLAGLLITYFFILDFDKLVESIVPTLLYSALIGITLWKGNEWISIQIHNKADWKKRPERKFGVGVLVMIVYSILAIIFVSFVWFVFWEGGSVTNFEMPSFRLFAILLGVTLIIGFGLNIREFIIEKQDILLREEKLKRK